jgi:molecular chaperone IbpA
VAGFKEEEITVEQKENILTITGDSHTDGEYVFKGIATRKFRKVFPLVEAAEVTQAALKNGLLEININVAIPEEQKPKLIPINNS